MSQVKFIIHVKSTNRVKYTTIIVFSEGILFRDRL